MLKIRDDQYERLGEGGREGFLERLKAFLRREAPKLSEPMNEEQLHDFCSRSVDLCLAHELHRELHVVRFTLCMLQMGVDLETRLPPEWVMQPRINDQLGDDDWIQHIRDGMSIQLDDSSDP